MNASRYILFAGKGDLRIGTMEDGVATVTLLLEHADDEYTPTDIADAAINYLNEHDYDGSSIVLGLEASQCLSASINTSDLPRRATRQSLIYRLEEKVPIPAEDFVADFVKSPANHTPVIGICAQSDELQQLVDALESKGITVDVITPIHILALQSLNGELDQTDRLLWRDNNDQTHLFDIKDRTPVNWYALPPRPRKMAVGDMPALTHLNQTENSDLQITIGNVEADDLASFTPSDDANTKSFSRQPIDAATEAAQRILEGAITPLINLRRDALAATDTLRHIRKPLTFAVAGIIFTLVAAIGLSLWKAHQYNAHTEQILIQEQSVYRKAMPNSRIPLSIQSRLAAEERRLANLSGTPGAPDGSSTRTAIPKQKPIIRAFATALASLPINVRLRILRVRIDNRRFDIEGECRSHSDAATIASALRNTKILQVESPRTRRLRDKGVSFTVTGSLFHISPKLPGEGGQE